jgi:signal transduction histidine kinase
MAKFRLALLCLVLGIALPGTSILLRATASLEREVATRHETVAKRLFDEMERSLSDFLLREESRAAVEYDRALADSISVGGVGRALAGLEEPFVLGWFTVSAGGAPRIAPRELVARDRVARAVADTLMAPARSGAVTSSDESGSDAVDPDRTAAARAEVSRKRATQMARAERKEALALAPDPGRTRALGRKGAEQASSEAEDSASPEPSAYGVLQSLNRAGSQRSERQSKALRRSEAPSPLSDREGEERFVAPDLRGPGHEDPDAAPEMPRESIPGEAREDRLARSTGLIVDPMVGRPAGQDTLVLARSVWRAGSFERQGLVLDRPRLVAWLQQRVIEETGLVDQAGLALASEGVSFEAVTSGYAYLHRFAEPFDEVVARLDLAALPGLDATRTIYWLALLLVATVALGVFAVDRMVRVVLDYSQRRSDFVAAVSHELKTPLTAIRMYGEMLRDGLVPSDAKRLEYYETITAESERLSRLIDNVLEFSRLEQDRRELEWVVGGLAETLRSVARTLEPHAREAGFELAVEIEEGLPRVRYDRDALTQIVFNLVDNACKYADGSRSKRVTIVLDRAEGGGVALRLRDGGPGVPEDEIGRIFEPFYRRGEELTRTTKGTGIGLALVRELAEKMGGRVRARRPAEGGFEVVVDLPSAERD